MSSAPSLYGPKISSTKMPRSLWISGRPGGTGSDAEETTNNQLSKAKRGRA